jgi:hypothetical protein
MSGMMKFSIALLLALAAGVGNSIYLSSRSNVTSHRVLRFKTQVEPGDRIVRGMLESVPIAHTQDISADSLEKTFILRSRLEAILDLPAPRRFREGDLLLQQDFQVDRARYEVLGPFLLVSVGQRIRAAGSSFYSDGSETNTISVIVEPDEAKSGDRTVEIFSDRKVQRLLDIIASPSKENRIVTVQLYPNIGLDTPGFSDFQDDFGDDFEGLESPEQRRNRLALDVNQRAIIVPLTGIQTIPEMLTLGDRIGFVVPHID